MGDGSRPDETRRTIALDGLRGFALIGMLGWHAELDWVRGGFARMTIFFVLSGYLATRSWDRRRSDGFRAFWTRRTLRLLPMTLVGVGVAVAVTLAVGSDATRAALGGDVVSVVTYTSNWHFLDTDQSYGELFERRSAFQHYWSLSIEEQLFVVLPVLLAGAALLSRWSRRPRWIILAAGGVAVGVASVAAGPSPDAIYFGTQTRLLEFLAGAALAASVTIWSSLRLAPRTGSLVVWVGRASAAAVVVTLVAVDREAAWLYEGGIHLFALPVVAVILAIERGEPWLTTTLQLAPLVWLGRAALSIYVMHWPVYVLIDDLAPHGWTPWVMACVKLAAGVVVGGYAHRLVERPLLDDTRHRLASGLPVVRPRLVPMVGVAALLAIVGFTTSRADVDYDFAGALAAFGALPASEPTPAVHRIGVFGGSTALMNGLGLAHWADASKAIAIVDGDVRLGCGLLENGERPQSLDARGNPTFVPIDSECGGWPRDWERAARGRRVEDAVVFFGVWDIADWRVDGGSITSIDDPVFRDQLRARLDRGIDRLVAGGVEHVVLMTSPVVGTGRDEVDLARLRGLPDDHAARTSTFNAMLVATAAARPDHVSVFDYASVVESNADIARLLPDGVHPTVDSATELWSGDAGQRLLRHLGHLGR